MPKARSPAKPAGLPIIHPFAAGIDIGSRFHVVAVSPDLCDEPGPDIPGFYQRSAAHGRLACRDRHQDGDDGLIDRFDNYREYQIASAQQQYVAHLCWHASFNVGDELAAAYEVHERAYDCRRWAALVARHTFLPQS